MRVISVGCLLLIAAVAWADPPATATMLQQARTEAKAYHVTEARRLFQQAIDQARLGRDHDPSTGGLALAAALREYGQYLGELHLFREDETALTEAAAVLKRATEAGATDSARGESAEVAHARSLWLEAAGRFVEAAAWAGEEYRLRKEHAAAASADTARRDAWLRCGDRYALALFNTGPEDRAEAVLDECLAVARPAPAAPDDPALFPLIGRLTNTKALILKDTGRWEEAERAYTAAVAVHRKAVDRDPTSAAARYSLVSVLRNRGLHHQLLEKAEESLRDLEEATTLERSVPADSNADTKQLLQSVQRAIQFASAWMPAAGTPCDPAALAAFRKRAADHPDIPAFQLDLLMALGLDAVRPVEANGLAAGEAAVKEMLGVATGLQSRHPEVLAYRLNVAGYRVSMAVVLRQQGQLAQADALQAAGIAELGKLADERPDEPVFRKRAGEMHVQAASVCLAAGRTDDAVAELAAAAPHYRRLVERFPNSFQYGKMDAQNAQTLGMNLFNAGRFADAEAVLRDNAPVWEALARRQPNAPYFRDQLARTYEWLASARNNQAGKLADARDAVEKAIPVRVAVAKDFPADPRFGHRLAQSHVMDGNLRANANDQPAAAAAYGRAIAVLESMLKADPKDVVARHELADALRKRGTAYNATGRFADFTKDYERADELRRGVRP